MPLNEYYNRYVDWDKITHGVPFRHTFQVLYSSFMFLPLFVFVVRVMPLLVRAAMSWGVACSPAVIRGLIQRVAARLNNITPAIDKCRLGVRKIQNYIWYQVYGIGVPPTHNLYSTCSVFKSESTVVSWAEYAMYNMSFRSSDASPSNECRVQLSVNAILSFIVHAHLVVAASWMVFRRTPIKIFWLINQSIN